MRKPAPQRGRSPIQQSFPEKLGLQLPECKRPNEEGNSFYQSIIGHPIEDSYVFKDWVQEQYEQGRPELHLRILCTQGALLSIRILCSRKLGSVSPKIQAKGAGLHAIPIPIQCQAGRRWTHFWIREGKKGPKHGRCRTLEWQRKARPYLFFQACSDSSEDQVGEPCDGKPSRTVRRALKMNERFTTTSLQGELARFADWSDS
ncbi:NADH dehydrogenase subunit 5 [Canna indica]|uniref:NADH dehydrogenase subunit 5 (Mitochondrion) n=1 Tax=Canna indica TaxID=4628 RepID=A0AAQ3QCV3_9LILI|nr:NADH dehydrogenase subunit 5 [Canna indica]